MRPPCKIHRYAGDGKFWSQAFVGYTKKLLCAKLYVRLRAAHKQSTKEDVR